MKYIFSCLLLLASISNINAQYRPIVVYNPVYPPQVRIAVPYVPAYSRPVAPVYVPYQYQQNVIRNSFNNNFYYNNYNPYYVPYYRPYPVYIPVWQN